MQHAAKEASTRPSTELDLVLNEQLGLEDVRLNGQNNAVAI